MAQKDDKEFILFELAIIMNANKLLSVLYDFDCHMPEKESRELDTFLKSGKKLLEKVLSFGTEKYDFKRHMAFKYLNAEEYNYSDYRYQLEYAWKNIRYYQDGTLCLKDSNNAILLSPWEPKSKEVIQRIAKAKKSRATISKNKDANIKRQEKMEARYETGRKISSPEEFADMIIKKSLCGKNYFYAAQWRAYFGLPTPVPDDLKEKDIGFLKQYVFLQELYKKDPYLEKVQPIINRTYNIMDNMLYTLNIDHYTYENKTSLCFLTDKAIQNTMEYLKENTVDYDYSWKEIMRYAVPEAFRKENVNKYIYTSVDIDNLTDIQDCSARKVMEAWGILPKKEKVAV